MWDSAELLHRPNRRGDGTVHSCLLLGSLALFSFSYFFGAAYCSTMLSFRYLHRGGARRPPPPMPGQGTPPAAAPAAAAPAARASRHAASPERAAKLGAAKPPARPPRGASPRRRTS